MLSSSFGLLCVRFCYPRTLFSTSNYVYSYRILDTSRKRDLMKRTLESWERSTEVH